MGIKISVIGREGRERKGRGKGRKRKEKNTEEKGEK